MEAKHYILPAAALVVTVVFAGGQRKRISELREENRELHGRIVAARNTDSVADARRPDRTEPSAAPIDWDMLAVSLRDNPAGHAPGQFSIQRRLLAMDSAALLAALDRIAAMDLDDATRLRLENLILDPGVFRRWGNGGAGGFRREDHRGLFHDRYWIGVEHSGCARPAGNAALDER